MTIKQQIKVFEKLMAKVSENGYTITLGSMPIEKVIAYKIYYKFIFDHGFQKALWGVSLVNTEKKGIVIKDRKMLVNMDDFKPEWQWYAQELVLQEDYLEYLKRFI